MSLLPVSPLGAVRLAHEKSEVKGSVCKKFLKSWSVAERVRKVFTDTPLLPIACTVGLLGLTFSDFLEHGSEQGIGTGFIFFPALHFSFQRSFWGFEGEEHIGGTTTPPYVFRVPIP